MKQITKRVSIFIEAPYSQAGKYYRGRSSARITWFVLDRLEEDTRWCSEDELTICSSLFAGEGFLRGEISLSDIACPFGLLYNLTPILLRGYGFFFFLFLFYWNCSS